MADAASNAPRDNGPPSAPTPPGGYDTSRPTDDGFAAMLAWFALLMLLPIGGDLLMHILELPLPGSVAGFLALFAWLCWRGPVPPQSGLADVSGELVRRLPIFLVPPCIGMLVHLDILEDQGVPILAAIFAGTGTTIAVTGLVARAGLRSPDRSAAEAAAHAVTDSLAPGAGR